MPEKIEQPEQFDEQQAVANFLAGLELDELEPRQKLIKVTQAVAEIPFGPGRSVKEALVNGTSSCNGKHKLLKACYDQLGIDSHPVVCTFQLGQEGLALPRELQEILEQGDWEEDHNFVQLADGTDVDVTWNSRLAPYGFRVFPKDWDGKTSLHAVHPIRRWDNVIDIDAKKAEIADEADDETKKRRERFLDGFRAWITSINFPERTTQ